MSQNRAAVHRAANISALKEARKSGKLDRFAKEQPSEGNASYLIVS
jgi:hypothetical protein